jgi:hypothetical protein
MLEGVRTKDMGCQDEAYGVYGRRIWGISKALDLQGLLSKDERYGVKDEGYGESQKSH